MARSYKRTPEVEKRLLDALRMGSTYRLAAQYAGVTHVTFYRWLEKDVTFLTKVKEAEGAAVVGWLAKIEKAASEGNWQAAAWKLERRYPEDYSLRQRLEHSGVDGGPIQHEDLTVARDRLTGRIVSLAARVGTEQLALGPESDRSETA